MRVVFQRNYLSGSNNTSRRGFAFSARLIE
jgi:hypothetical protein